MQEKGIDISNAEPKGINGLPQADIDRLAAWVHEDLEPDLTILLDAPATTGMSRAGNSLERTYQIHGNINYCRCSETCTPELIPLPEALKQQRQEKTLTDAELALLRCPRCSAWLRPHVLWFDEAYDETWFRFDSSLQTAARTSLLLIVGTSGATTLPNLVAELVFQNNGTIIDINPEPNPFTKLALASPEGQYIQGSAAEILPDLAAMLGA